MQSVDTDSLRNAALQRFGSIPDYVDAYIENLGKGLSMGYSSPRWNIVRLLDQLDVLLESPLKYSPFFGPVQRNPTPIFQKVFPSLIKQTKSCHRSIPKFSERGVPTADTPIQTH